jgi:hypothetical protein
LQAEFPELFGFVGIGGAEPTVKLPDPSVLPANTGNGVAFSPNGVYMSVAHGYSPYINIYKSDFPFDIETEFYVPDVTELPGIPVGGWTPSVSPKAYVRAK